MNALRVAWTNLRDADLWADVVESVIEHDVVSTVPEQDPSRSFGWDYRFQPSVMGMLEGLTPVTVDVIVLANNLNIGSMYAHRMPDELKPLVVVISSEPLTPFEKERYRNHGVAHFSTHSGLPEYIKEHFVEE